MPNGQACQKCVSDGAWTLDAKSQQCGKSGDRYVFHRP